MIDVINNFSMSWWNWMLAMFWQVGLLIILVAFVDMFIKRWAWPQLRYALWLMVLIKLVIPPGVSMSGSLIERVQPRLDKLINLNIKEPSTIAEYSYSPFIISVDSIVDAPQASIQPVGAFTLANLETDITESSAIMSEYPQSRLIWQSYAMTVWFSGMIMLAFWLIIRLRKLRVCQSRKDSTSAMPQSFHLMMSRCARQLKLNRVPRVVVTKKVVCPAVFGVFRPILLMPKGYLRSLSRKDTEHMLLHELAHIKRHDPSIHSFYLILQIVYWFNPLLWLARRQLIHLRELCCDATVARILKNKTKEYRQSLIDIARQFLTKSVEPGLGLLGLFEDANRLLIRLNWLEKKTWRYQKMKNLTIITIITLMIVFVLPMAKAQEQTSTEDHTTHQQQAEDVMLHIQNDNSTGTEQVEEMTQMSEQMRIVQAQLEKLETEKQKLQKELAKLKISNQKAESKAEDKVLPKDTGFQNIDEQMDQWENSEEFKKWEEDIEKWAENIALLEQNSNVSGNSSVPPMPQMPAMPELSHLLHDIKIPINIPNINIPTITIPKIQMPVNAIPSHIHTNEIDDSKISETKQMEFTANIISGAPLIVQNNVGNIFLNPSKDGNCNVKAVIRATADTIEDAKKILEQVSINNESTNERVFIKPVKSGDDNWENLNVDLYITIPSDIALDISTNVGSITITDIKGQIKALTNVGTINAVNISDVIKLTTKVGDVEFTVPDDFSAKVKADTKIGSIQSEFPIDITKKDMMANTAKGTIGSGENTINLTTEVGKIRIKKQSLIDIKD